jgi:dephospho-CoA kinase
VLKVGLTGGIASGKTVVGKMFVALGAHVIRADDIAHELMAPAQPLYQEIVLRFGTEILNPDGTIHRAKLAEVAFGSQSRIEELNRIIHPTVISKQEQWMDEISQRHPRAVAIVEAALILEADLAARFDKLVVVTCRPEQRAERWAYSRKVSLTNAKLEIARRMAAQFSDESKIKAANYVIDNSRTLPQTEEQVKAIYQELSDISEDPELKTHN